MRSMTSRAERHRIDDVDLDGAAIEYLLCDADGNLFPSEEPAFDASVIVTNQFLQRFGLPGDRSAEELRVATTGKNFRSTAVDSSSPQGSRWKPASPESGPKR